jgi:hypothetical protein
MSGILAVPTEGIEAFVANHNIAGSGGVLNAAGDELENYLYTHYAARGIDQIPYVSPDAPFEYYIRTPDEANLQPQADYRRALSGLPYQPVQDLQTLLDRGVKKALYLPYIRLIDDPLPDEIEWVRYGLPPHVTLRLKDKAYMHNWMLNRGFAKYIPNFIACDAVYLPRFGMRMLRKISDMLEIFGMRGRYPLGLMIRGAVSDGNYAMAAIVEAIDDMHIRDMSVKKGQFMLKPNGKSEHLEIFDTAEAALRRVLQHLRHENNPELDDRVVMSRLLDIDISPGLCTAVVAGELYDFPFNGQYMKPGDTACTGTTTFTVAVGQEVARQVSQTHLAQSQSLLRHVLNSFLAAEDKANLYAMLNMDVMTLGSLEIELYNRALDHPQGAEYINNIGLCNSNYAPRIYNPNTILFAEVNPRDTNWTIAMKAVLQALRQPCTVENLQALADGSQVQVLARDHWDIPPGMNIAQARDLLLQFHQSLPPGDGMILRMPDNPAGVIIYTQSGNIERVNQIAQEAYDFLALRGAEESPPRHEAAELVPA